MHSQSLRGNAAIGQDSLVGHLQLSVTIQILTEIRSMTMVFLLLVLADLVARVVVLLCLHDVHDFMLVLARWPALGALLSFGGGINKYVQIAFRAHRFVHISFVNKGDLLRGRDAADASTTSHLQQGRDGNVACTGPLDQHLATHHWLMLAHLGRVFLLMV